MKKLYFMFLLAIMSTVMVSCDGWNEPYYIDDIVGSWETYYGYDGYAEYDIMGYDMDRFDFYSDYTGRYTYYSRYGLTYLDFDWDTRNGRLFIWYENGNYDEFYYGFDDYGYLVLSDSRRFRRYIVYRPSGFYYDQEKTLGDGEATGIDKSQSVHESHDGIKSINQRKD